MAVTLAALLAFACSDPPSPAAPAIGSADGKQPAPAPAELPPGPEAGGPPPGTDGAEPPPGAAGAQPPPDPSAIAGAGTDAPAASPFPAAALLAAAAPVVEAAAPLQPGSWVDGVEPTVLANTCELEEVDALGDLLDAGRIRLDLPSGAAGGAFTLVPRPDEDEDDDGSDDAEEEDGLDLGFGLSAPIACTIGADTGAVDCTALDEESKLAGGGAIALRHQFLVSIPDPRLLQLEIWTQARCVDCDQPPAKVGLPCTTKLRRALVFEGTEGTLGPVKEGRASGVALPAPAPTATTTTQP